MKPIDGVRKLMLLLLLALFFGAGLWIAVVTVSDFRTAVSMTEWKSTEGLIIKSQVRGSFKRRRLVLLYEYEVDGRSFRGHRKSLQIGLIRHKVSDRAELYPKGRQVIVYFDPDQPSMSVLEPGVYWPGVVFQVLAALIFTGVGAGGIYLTFRYS